MPVIALLDGGDWADASVEFVVLPDGMDLQGEHIAYRRWYREVYRPALAATAIGQSTPIAYQGFKEWLLLRGARSPREDELIEYDVAGNEMVMG